MAAIGTVDDPLSWACALPRIPESKPEFQKVGIDLSSASAGASVADPQAEPDVQQRHDGRYQRIHRDAGADGTRR